ncbi:MAG TPA: thioredoxin family protein [Anaerolineae bacterium]|nr:thioredoxin family protein [Anaerolineae bacterium]
MSHFAPSKHITLFLVAAAILAGCIAPDATPTVTATAKPLPRKVATLPRPYNEQADPAPDIAAALKQAKAGNKLVLLDFGANWCPDCLVLAKHFENAQVKPFLDKHFIVVKIDVGQWDKNLDIAERYGNPIKQGIPAVVVLNADGKQLASTADGSLASASTTQPQDILAYLKQWAEAKP